jgi:hypothetical protein
MDNIKMNLKEAGWDTRVEAGSNTSTVTLRVVGGDEKGSLKSEAVKYGLKSQGTRTRERLRWQYKRQTRPLVREGAPQEQDCNCYKCNKDLVVSPRWVLCSKTDWPADRRS